MPFADLSSPKRERLVGTKRQTVVTMGINSDRAVVVRIGEDVIKAVGWSHRCFLLPSEGFGLDSGMLRLDLSDGICDGAYRLCHWRSVGFIRIGKGRFSKHAMPDKLIPSMIVPHQIDGSAIVILMPDYVTYTGAEAAQPKETA